MNEKEFKYLGFDKAIEQGYDGTGLTVAYWDTIRESDGLEHYKMTEDILKQGLPKAKLVYVKASGNADSDMKKILNTGAKICNISMIGLELELINPITKEPFFPTYKEFIKKLLIVASSGNSGIEEFNYPSSYDDVWSTSAVIYSNGNVKPAGFSTINNRVDSGMFTNIALTSPVGGYTIYSGTSCSAPMQTCFFGQFYCAFYKKYNKYPEPYEAVMYGRACSKDIHSEGYDINTGYGITIHNFDNVIDYVWSWKQKKYIIKKTWLEKAKTNNEVKGV